MANEYRIQSAAQPLRPLQRFNRVGHIVRDCLLALTVFGLLAAIIGWNSTPPQPIPSGDLLATGANPLAPQRSEQNVPQTIAALNSLLSLPQMDTRALLQPSDRTVAVAILASVFAAIIAFNLWFLRHLSRLSNASRAGNVKRR